MTAKIYKPARTAMQSGSAKTKNWLLEFEPEEPRSVEPLMGEHAYWEDTGAGRTRFREIASVPGVTAVSSQGGVIPDVVEALLLAERRGGSRGTVAVPEDGVPSHKASTWVLGFAADGVLLFADYYRRPPG